MRIAAGLTTLALAGGVTAGLVIALTGADAHGPAAPFGHGATAAVSGVAAGPGPRSRSAGSGRPGAADGAGASRAPARSGGAAGASGATGSGPAARPAVRVPAVPQGVRGTGAALVDLDTNTLLWSRALETERPMGSVTKVMTALVVISAGHLNRLIAVPKAVIGYVRKYGGASAGPHPGDLLTARQLLAAMLAPSGCDAAYTLAVSYGPGMPAFLDRMNAMARRLGLTRTHFTSPDGLPYPTEYSTYSTPGDLVRLGEATMDSPVFRSIVAQRSYRIARGPGHHAYFWANTNDLIGSYAGADGIKTGYTNAAGHCLLFRGNARPRDPDRRGARQPRHRPGRGRRRGRAGAELGIQRRPARPGRGGLAGAGLGLAQVIFRRARRSPGQGR
jgi:D-alanyl-D-alanine carboxypeptidase (penicillin-binding protein 5/6)